MKVIDRNTMDVLFEVLKRREFRLVGPTVREGTIVYDELSSTADLPVGWTDEHDGGTYHLKKREDAALFGSVFSTHFFQRARFPALKWN